ncbi:MAG: hypothetical protein K9K64_10745 [Desulfohalobiaceae bacterium]|nr:hypothetical protein [Desulfohalobiaceae bacterium]
MMKPGSVFLLIMFLVIGCGLFVRAEEPALPEGLGSFEADRTREPELPAGLGDSADSGEPARDTREEPGLPAGLEGGNGREPALPSGLSPDEDRASGQKTGGQASDWSELFGLPLHGFLEGRLGPRLQSDPVQSKEATLGETRLQLETEKFWDAGSFDLTADIVLDGITEEAAFDLRRARYTFSPLPSVDIRAGRQVLSWGTGDLLFINDLFPKDWVSFLSGRDVEYLKAPGDAVRLGWFNDLFNLNLVYTPKFDPDRFVDGERLSYWNPALGRIAGEDNQIQTKEPDDWFDDDEIALRMYRNISGYELALYAYSGYWKSPAGQDPDSGKFLFPKLNVYGASLQGTIGPGIGNIEFGFYDSREDRAGDDPFLNNSELHLLIGYEQELATEFTGSIQYYLERLQDYNEYREALPPGSEARDENRHLLTLRLTKLLLNQDLTLSLFTFYSPSDQDVYFRPKASYELSDAWTVVTGGNLFMGKEDQTFFGQFENNSNWYLGLRYSF